MGSNLLLSVTLKAQHALDSFVYRLQPYVVRIGLQPTSSEFGSLL